MKKRKISLFLCSTLFLMLIACGYNDVSNPSAVSADTERKTMKTSGKISSMSVKDNLLKDLVNVPDAYKTQDNHKGKIERLNYTTNSYDSKNMTLNKSLNVYLPSGYDPNDTTKKYNVLYLLHGGGENQDTIFGGPGRNTELMKIVDNMIYNGDMEPIIIVTPNFYNAANNTYQFAVKNFHKELIKDILPTVESKYHTYAASGSTKDLTASRSHRAFGGFSMGSACTWYNFIYCLDYFEYFMPLSGDCWMLGDKAGFSKPKETAEYLANATKEYSYGPDKYFIFCATGTDDAAYNNMVPQIEAMKKINDKFIYTDDITKGNLNFRFMKGGTHSWNYINTYIYNILPYLFFK